MDDQEPEVSPTDQPPGTGVSLSLTEIETFRDRLEQQKANKLKAEVIQNGIGPINKFGSSFMGITGQQLCHTSFNGA